ncbi:hypothetical protein Rctr197k_221 [Virus Rctr197k]|nr:hypothetical protein Rctr197k_221 [Virus Rctr197k]
MTTAHVKGEIDYGRADSFIVSFNGRMTAGLRLELPGGDRVVVVTSSAEDEAYVNQVYALLNELVLRAQEPEQLGRFGHHPDPAVDFCVEVDAIEGLEADVEALIAQPEELTARIKRAMDFRVGGNEQAVIAKNRLRSIEARRGVQ